LDVPRLRAVPEVIARSGSLVVVRDPRRPSGRLLIQGDMEASYVDLADSRHLEFDYMRWIRIVLRNVGAGRVLHLGGGACALARALAAEAPRGQQEVVEIDPEVLAIARAHMGLRRIPGLRVRQGDGREWIARQPDGSRDAIVIDAFEGAVVPRRLVTAQALGDAARVAPLTAINVVDDRSAQAVYAVSAGLAEAYACVWTLGGRSGNTVVIGSGGAPDLSRISAQASADVSPARLTGPEAWARRLLGAVAWHDGEP
jgi:hypothetical protein